MITPPENWTVYRDHVLSKIEAYCNAGLWEFDPNYAALWLANFAECEEDEYLAVRILDKIIYRSNEMLLSTYHRYVATKLRGHLKSCSAIASQDLDSWMRFLSQGSGPYRNDFNTRFVAVTRKYDSGHSGSAIIRKLNSNLIATNLTKTLDQIKDNESISHLVLIDDVLGSGKQFCDYAMEVNLESLLQTKTIIYSPLIALDTGVSNLLEKYPSLIVDPLETLDPRDAFFVSDDDDDEYYFRNDKTNSIEAFKIHYLALMKKHSPRFIEPLGWESAALTLAFEWGCPNQTLPICYLDSSIKVESGWRQLFSRRS